MTNTVATAVCAACIAAVQIMPLPVWLALPTVIVLGMLLGFFLTHSINKDGWN